MGIKILTPGMFTTVQDGGRKGYQSSGFSPAGVMDTRSYRIANLLVDNDADEAVLEIMMLGPSIEFGEDEVIAVTGAPVDPRINERPVSMNRAIQVKRGDILKFGYPKTGRLCIYCFCRRAGYSDGYGKPVHSHQIAYGRISGAEGWKRAR